jgi:hypothetical protein
MPSIGGTIGESEAEVFARKEREGKPMSEASKARREMAEQVNKMNVKIMCIGKATERLFSEREIKGATAPAPSMAQIIREADMLHQWMVDGRLPAVEMVPVVFPAGSAGPGIRSN